MLDNPQTPAFSAKDRFVGYTNIFHADSTVVGGHVEGPKHFFDFETLGVCGRKESRNAVPVACFSAGTSENQIVLGFVYARIPGLGTVDDPLVTVTDSGCFHMGSIRSVVWLSNPKRKTRSALGKIIDPFGFLFVGTVLNHEQQTYIIADDGMLILQVVV